MNRTVRRLFRDHANPVFRPREIDSTPECLLDDMIASHLAGDRIEVTQDEEGSDTVTNIILKHRDSTTFYTVTDERY